LARELALKGKLPTRYLTPDALISASFWPTQASPMLAHKAEEEAVAAIEYIKTGYGHVNYAAIPSVTSGWVYITLGMAA
jgi:hypothetical protein